MGNYRSCLYEKTHHGYFQCMRDYINQFKEVSFLIKTESGHKIIPANLIFHIIYGYAPLKYSDLSKGSHLIVLLEKANGENVKYSIDAAEKRRDIYFDESLETRTKIPESILLTNQDDCNNPEKLKLIEARAYNFRTEEDIKKLHRRISKRFDNVFYIPLFLSLIPLLDNRQYFPEIYYISRPYTIETPYVYKTIHGSFGVTKKPIKTYNKDLNFFSIVRFEEYPTTEPYLLGLNYDFELDRRNLDKFEIQINYDDFMHRLYSSIAKIVETISSSGICPADIGPYQIIIDNNGNIKFIDFAEGFDVPISQKGLEKVIIKAIKNIIEGFEESPLLEHCTKVGNNVVCNANIKNSEFSRMVTQGIRDQLKKYDNKKLDNIIKNITIGGSRLSDIIQQYGRKDKFEENEEIISRALELYLKSLKSHNN